MAARCAAELLHEGNSGHGCLALLPPIHSAARRPKSWDEYDLRISVPTPSDGTSRAMLINPSVLCRHGRLLLAARAMWAVSVQPPCTDVWRSRVIVSGVEYERERRALVARGCTADVTPAFSTRSAAALAERCAASGLEPSVGLGARLGAR